MTGGRWRWLAATAVARRRTQRQEWRRPYQAGSDRLAHLREEHLKLIRRAAARTNGPIQKRPISPGRLHHLELATKQWGLAHRAASVLTRSMHHMAAVAEAAIWQGLASATPQIFPTSAYVCVSTYKSFNFNGYVHMATWVGHI
jgi:hypothetical protein